MADVFHPTTNELRSPHVQTLHCPTLRVTFKKLHEETNLLYSVLGAIAKIPACTLKYRCDKMNSVQFSHSFIYVTVKILKIHIFLFHWNFRNSTD